MIPRLFIESLRPSNWRKASKIQKKLFPFCAICKITKKLEAHDIIPYHLIPDPESWTVEDWLRNMITLCRHDHGRQAHCADPGWRCYNPEIVDIAAVLEKYRKKCLRGLNLGMRMYNHKLGPRSIPKGKAEYVVRLPLDKLAEKFGYTMPVAIFIKDDIIKLLIKIGQKWLFKHRIDVVKASVVGGKVFIHIKSDRSALWDLFEQLPEIERIDANFVVFALPLEQGDFIPLGKSKKKSKKKPIRAATHETIKYLGIDQIHKDSRFEMGKGIKIGFADTGIHRQAGKEPQLLVDPENPKSEDRVKGFKNFMGFNQRPHDDVGHGNPVACIVGGGAKYHSGQNKTYIGGLPLSTLYAAKVLDSQGRGTLFSVIQGLEWLVEQHVDIINMSLGSNQNTNGLDSLSIACDEAWGLGIIVVIAMGNSGNSKPSPPYCNGTVGTPACSFKPIKATATSGIKMDPEQIMTWASRSPTADGRSGKLLHVLAAPGLQIQMYDARGRNKSGTSYACPFDVVHVAIITRALQVAGIPYDPDYVRLVAEKYCFSLGYVERYGPVEGDCIEGHGRIDPLKAWKEITGGSTPPECANGAVEVIEQCPDGTWKKRRVCKNSKWKLEERACPGPGKKAIATIEVEINGVIYHTVESEKTVDIHINVTPELKEA